MSSISSLNSLAAMASRPVSGTQPVQPVRRLKQIEREDQPQQTQAKQPAQAFDEYTQAPPQPSAGRYYVGQNEDGQRQIFFDAPTDFSDNKADNSPVNMPIANPSSKDGDKADILTTNTDKVDAEIRQLRNKQSQLQQQVNQAANDPERQAELQKQLNQTKNELQAKDNDSYRRQNAQYTQGTPF